MKLKGTSKGLPEARVLQVLAELMSEGQVRKLPPKYKGRNNLLGTGPVRPRDYLVPVFATLSGAFNILLPRLETEGIIRDQFIEEAVRACQETLARVGSPTEPTGPETVPSEGEAVSGSSDPQAILDGLRQVNPGAGQGAMVSVRELRRFLRERLPDKAHFDAAVLRLARERRIDLHQHDLPTSLTEAQREEELVPDEQGRFYNGIVLRP